MPAVILQARYDGEHIVLDEPFNLPLDTRLLITVLTPDAERMDWASLGAQSLARAYGTDEPEYTAADLKSE